MLRTIALAFSYTVHPLRKLSRFLLALALVAACARAPAPQAPSPPSSPFAFHVGFWLSLHLRLYGESGPRGAREPLDDPDWQAALGAYRAAYPDRGPLALLTDGTLTALGRKLADTPDDAAVDDPVLTKAAPVYRAKRWPEDRARAQAWIAGVDKLIAVHGATLTRELAKAYRTPWPATPMRVEVVPYATFAGAYTILEPTLISVSGRDERNQGNDGLEIVFHEASHALMGPLAEALGRTCPAAPRQLWHAVLFYTTGQIVARVLGPGYVPYADKQKLWDRLPGREALRVEWQPYLDGQRSFDEGIARLCATVAK